MAEKFDVAIVGSGLGGLVSGALLAKEGKKVAVLESKKAVGGRAVAIPIMGIMTEFGFHGIVNNGHLTNVLKACKLDIPMQPLTPNFVVYHNGKFYEAPSKIEDVAKFEYIPQADRAELMDIMTEIKNTPFDATEDYDLMGWGDWLDKRTKSRDNYDYLALLANIPMTEEHTSNLSAGEALRTVGCALREGEWSIYPRDGAMNVVNEALAKFITDNGGAVYLNAPAREITLKNGVVTGVTAENKDSVLRIEAPIVISNIPIWDIFKLVDQWEFPHWFVDKCRELESHLHDSPSSSFGITCVSSVPLNNYRTSVLLPCKDELQQSGPSYVKWLSQPTNFAKGLGGGKHLFQYGPVPPRSYVKLLKERKSIFEKELNNLWKEIFAMHPHFKKEHILWQGGGIIPATDLTLKYPGNAWRQRIDVEAPMVKNLYFANDNVRGWGVGMDSASCSGILAAQRITKKDLGLNVKF
ncbi:MAG: phytoene desaturase family protein [Smithellaceae bacterium]